MSRHEIPILPVLSGRIRLFGPGCRAPSLLDVGEPLLVRSGSVAIRLALEHAGLNPGDEILVPAFHCSSMSRPALDIGMGPVFYPMRSNLQIDLECLTAVTSARSRAVLVPHFFGQRQQLTDIRSFCEARGMVLIEDCAHAFFGGSQGPPLGSSGHYAIGSPRKFLPLVEGGLLTSAFRNLADLHPRPAPFGRSAQVAFDSVDVAIKHDRLGFVRGPMRLIKTLARSMRSGPRTQADQPAQAPGDAGKDSASDASAWEGAALITKLALRTACFARIVKRRRRNYAELRFRLSQKRGIRVLDLNLAADAAPYMLPILLEDPSSQFEAIKARGVPLWRWEHSTPGVCAVTDWYARALIQVPCHQDLRPDELEQIVAGFDCA